MNHKPRKATFITVVVVTLILVTAWVHSHIAGWRIEWSDPDAMVGGRIVSTNGQLYYQRCSLNRGRLPAALNGERSEPRKMPDGFSVGSNPNGKATVIAIANYPIPFTEPSPRQFIGMYAQNISRNSTERGNWYASTCEFLIGYWLATLLPALILILQCRKWYLLKRQPNTMNEETV